MTEIEKVKAEIKVLEKKLSFLEELEKTKSPAEEAYKRVYGNYPTTHITDGCWDSPTWMHFVNGYKSAQKDYKVGEHQEEQEEDEWKSVALRFGEKLSGYLSDGYYELSPAAWFRWAVFTYGKGQHIKDVVRESVKWCEEHPDESVEDYLKPHTPEKTEKLQEKNWYVDAKTLLKSNWEPKPKTPEETAQSLKEAFVEAQKTEKWKETQRKIDGSWMDEMVAELKGQNLTDLIYDWWEDVFTKNSNDDMETSIEDLVDQIQLWLPKEQSAAGSQNVYVECSVEGFNDCLTKIKGKLR